VDFNTDLGKSLGQFNVPVTNESKMIKFFRLPDTKLIISIAILYSSSSGSTDTKAPPDELVMSLISGKKRYKTGFNGFENTKKVRKDVVTTAANRMPLKSFESGEVMTVFLGKKEPVVISLECAK